jgi:hypothetical protein
MKVYLGWVMAAAVLVALGVSGCGPDHHQAVNLTGASPTADKGEIKGVLTTLGGPGSSPEPVKGTVGVYTLGGSQVSDVSAVSAFDFEVEPGAYSVRATVGKAACEPVVVKVVKGTVQDIELTCPNE